LENIKKDNPIVEYTQLVEQGDILVSKKIKKALGIINQVLEEDNEWVFDWELYDKSRAFIEDFCKHSKGKWARQPIVLSLWQKFIQAVIFGIVHSDTLLRKYREVLIVVARKNGKSTWASAIANYMLVGDGEHGADIYAVAVKRDQAKIVFDESKKMRDKSPILEKHIYKSKVALEFRATESKYEPLASETKSLDGLNGHCYIMDEVHAWTKQDLYDLCKGSLGAREQPLLFMISTAGTTRESVFDHQYAYAEQVLDGKVIDEIFMAFIFELDDPKEWTQPEMLEKANPNIDISVSRKYLVDYMNKAMVSPTEEVTYKTKHCNIRENNVNGWLSFSDIKNNKGTFDLEDWRDSYCLGGVDLSSTTDLTCATLLREVDGGVKEVIQMYFIAEERAKVREKVDKVPYSIWRDQGYIIFTEGNKVDFRDVLKWFMAMQDSLDLIILGIGYDPWSATYFVQEMDSSGFKMIEVRQGYKTLSPNMKLIEADFLDGTIAHNNNPILTWNIANVSTMTDPAGNIKPVKSGGSKSNLRIDGFASLLDSYVVYQDKREELEFIKEL
jgi:phage terminase large subunit-like protein